MLNLGRIQQRMSKLDNWALESNALEKTFDFPDFKKIVEFLNQLLGVCEKFNAHPDILISGNMLRLSIIYREGLEGKEFDFAEEIDKIKV